jgi:hypothetical protein
VILLQKGRKIKRSKSLYKARKSGFRKTLEVILLVAVVVGLGFVGYVIADTVSNLRCDECDNHPFSCACESEVITVFNPEPSDNGEPPYSNGTEDNNGGGDPPPPEDEPETNFVVYAPSNVLANLAALSVFLADAGANGFDTVVIEMKDETGRLLYQSGIELGEPPVILGNDRDIVTGTLSAEAIVAAITEEGLRPVARVNTLKDHIASVRLRDVGYAGWRDGRPDAGGRAWANPFFGGTRAYISAIVGELHQAGFEQVIFANTIFPTKSFSTLDVSILPGNVTNLETRFSGLVDFVNAVADENPDTEILLEFAVGCLSAGRAAGTAEMLRNGGNGFSANVAGVVPVFALGDFGAEVDGAAVVTLLETVAEHSGEFEIIPLLDVADLSDNDRDIVLSAFAARGYENFMLRN